MIHPSSGTFCALATRPLIRTLNSSYSLCQVCFQNRNQCHTAAGTTKTYTHISQIYLHCPAVFNKWSLDFVFQVINFLSEVPLWSPRFYVVLLTEWYPFSSKLWSFSECIKSQHSSSIIRHIARYLVNRIVHSKNGKHSICSDKRRLLHRVHGTDKNINRSQLRWFTFSVIPDNGCSIVK